MKLTLDPKLATAVFRRLLPEFVHGVQHIAFEHSPRRRDGRPKNSEVGEPRAVSKVQVDPRPRYVIRVRLCVRSGRWLARCARCIAFACRHLIIHVHEHDPDTDNRSLVCDSMRHDRISARTHAEGYAQIGLLSFARQHGFLERNAAGRYRAHL